MCACESTTRSIFGSLRNLSAGSIRRLTPKRDTAQVQSGTRAENGSVMIVIPVDLHQHGAMSQPRRVQPFVGPFAGFGNLRSGGDGTPQLARVLLPKSGRGLVDHRAGADDTHAAGAEQDAAAPAPFILMTFVHQYPKRSSVQGSPCM